LAQAASSPHAAAGGESSQATEENEGNKEKTFVVFVCFCSIL
jgi:hypothetical protein